MPDKIPLMQLLMQPSYAVLFLHDKEEIAEQMTLVDFDYYSRIHRTELTNQKWSKDKLNVLARVPPPCSLIIDLMAIFSFLFFSFLPFACWMTFRF